MLWLMYCNHRYVDFLLNSNNWLDNSQIFLGSKRDGSIRYVRNTLGFYVCRWFYLYLLFWASLHRVLQRRHYLRYSLCNNGRSSVHHSSHPFGSLTTFLNKYSFKHITFDSLFTRIHIFIRRSKHYLIDWYSRFILWGHRHSNVKCVKHQG